MERYGRDDAKEISAKAKELLKNNAIAVKANSTKVIDALKSGERVLKNVWKDILSDKAINQFAVMVYNNCDRDLLQVINKFASYKDVAGNCAIKHYSKVSRADRFCGIPKEDYTNGKRKIKMFGQI